MCVYVCIYIYIYIYIYILRLKAISDQSSTTTLANPISGGRNECAPADSFYYHPVSGPSSQVLWPNRPLHQTVHLQHRLAIGGPPFPIRLRHLSHGSCDFPNNVGILNLYHLSMNSLQPCLRGPPPRASSRRNRRSLYLLSNLAMIILDGRRSHSTSARSSARWTRASPRAPRLE